jgi:hypothetical protein
LQVVNALRFHDQPNGNRQHLGFNAHVQHTLVFSKPRMFDNFWTSLWAQLCTEVKAMHAGLARAEKVITVLVYCKACFIGWGFRVEGLGFRVQG